MSDSTIENKSQNRKSKGINKNFAILTLIVVIVALMGIILASMLIDLRTPLPDEQIEDFDKRDYRFDKEREDPELLELHLKLKTAITFANMTISLMLIFIYYKLYKETRSEFTMGLIVVMASFFIYALTSNPILPRLIGFPAIGFGLFSMIPDIFATIALFTLLYLSQK